MRSLCLLTLMLLTPVAKATTVTAFVDIVAIYFNFKLSKYTQPNPPV